MRGTFSVASRAVLVLTVVLWCWSWHRVTAQGTMRTVGIPKAGLKLTGPADSEFDGLAKGLLGEAPDPEFELLRNYSVILTNATENLVVAYDVRWEYTDANGRRISVDARDGRVGWLTGGLRYADNNLTRSPVLPAYTSTVMMPIAGFRKSADTSKRASDPRNLEDLRDSISGLSAGVTSWPHLTECFLRMGRSLGPTSRGSLLRFKRN